MENKKELIPIFTPVKELPQVWEGTIVPNTGHIDTFYFNTNLSIEETKKQLSKLTYDEAQSYMLAMSSSEGEPMILVICENNEYVITTEGGSSGHNYIFDSNDIMGTGLVGWGETANEFNFPMDLISFHEEYGLQNIGGENDKLSTLVSSTPFIKSNKVNEETIYKLETKKKLPDKWEGTPVPTNGMVEDIYFNTNLSIEETTKELDKLTYNINGGYFLFSDTNQDFDIVCIKVPGTELDKPEIEMLYVILEDLIDSTSQLQTKVIFSSEEGAFAGISATKGWNTKNLSSNGKVTFNKVADNVDAVSNNLISSVASITPHKRIKGKTFNEYSYWRWKDQKYNEVMNVMPSSLKEVEISIDQARLSQGQIILTEEEFALFENPNNVFFHLILIDSSEQSAGMISNYHLTKTKIVSKLGENINLTMYALYTGFTLFDFDFIPFVVFREPSSSKAIFSIKNITLIDRIAYSGNSLLVNGWDYGMPIGQVDFVTVNGESLLENASPIETNKYTSPNGSIYELVVSDTGELSARIRQQ